MQFIYNDPNWPNFLWRQAEFTALLAKLHHMQGRLLGRMENLGFSLRSEALLNTITLDVIKSSEIEGENLNTDQVRSSIAQRLGLEIEKVVRSSREVEGIVEMMLDATQNYSNPLTKNRLFDWHHCLFPSGYSGFYQIIVGKWRDDKRGPMQVVSGAIGKETVHYEAPPAKTIEKEIKQFLNWFNTENKIDPLIKTGIAHFWFETIHPFEDGNGRIGRAIIDMQLARADNSSQRFYSMSAQILKERKEYYRLLEHNQKNVLDITEWLLWFLNCLERSIIATEETLENVLKKSRFWKTYLPETFNERQQLMLNKLLGDFFGKMTTTKWGKITKCSPDTALRDINDLIQRGILIKEDAGGRSTSYQLNF